MTETEWIETFADILIEILKENDMTQKELARECGVSESVISGCIKKQRMPSLKTIINMSYVLGITTDDLIFYGDRII